MYRKYIIIGFIAAIAIALIGRGGLTPMLLGIGFLAFFGLPCVIALTIEFISKCFLKRQIALLVNWHRDAMRGIILCGFIISGIFTGEALRHYDRNAARELCETLNQMNPKVREQYFKDSTIRWARYVSFGVDKKGFYCLLYEPDTFANVCGLQDGQWWCD